MPGHGTQVADQGNVIQGSKAACNHSNRLQHICGLDIDSEIHIYKRTGVICTIGPACDSVDILETMIDKGLNICRLNMAHSTREYHDHVIKNIREAAKRVNKKIPTQVAIAVDITGPGVRIGTFRKELGTHLKLKKEESVRLAFNPDLEKYGDRSIVYVDQADFIKRAMEGNRIFIEDGPLSLIVKEKGPDYLQCVVDTEGEIGNCQQCHIPQTLPGKPKLTERDKDSIDFALDHNVDMIFVSWVWTPSIITEIRKELGIKADAIKVIAKIENYEGVKRYCDILKVSDGVMVARGDLGIDLPPEKVFLAQKMMIGLANKAGKPVICAAQMLDSMTLNPRPTRAEASDVANAILDGADCVMLSKETAAGKHPIRAVETICAICQEAEAAVFTDNVFRQLRQSTPMPVDSTHTIAIAAVEASIRCHSAAILVITTTGRSAALIAQYRPRCPIIAITRAPLVARSLHLHRGVFPILYEGEKVGEWYDDIDQRFQQALTVSKKRCLIAPDQIVVLVTGWMPGSGSTNTVRTITVPRSDEPYSITKLSHVKSHLEM